MPTADGLRVLLVTPTGRDAELLRSVLQLAGVQSEPLENVSSAVAVLRAWHVGALLIAEEALGKDAVALLTNALQEQPPWSALPILVLTTGGASTRQSRIQQTQRLPLGNTILLERPIRVATLVSSVRTALLERSRQYDRQQAETALRQSEKLALVGRMASSIAHEINNPLEAITNLLFLLEGTALSEQQRYFLNTAQSELARVSHIAAQTLTFNRQRDIRGEASVSSLLDSVLTLYHGRLSGSNIVIERRYQNTAPIPCYPGELRQVFANLIGNAFDAMRKEGGRIVLRERAATHPKTRQCGVRATLADNGQGMSNKVKAHLFEAFASTKGDHGNGLGLWISKGIIERHGGSIWLRSCTKPGQSGTVFSIFLPMDATGSSEKAA
jgi:signal transduction histidine kinase